MAALRRICDPRKALLVFSGWTAANTRGGYCENSAGMREQANKVYQLARNLEPLETCEALRIARPTACYSASFRSCVRHIVANACANAIGMATAVYAALLITIPNVRVIRACVGVVGAVTFQSDADMRNIRNIATVQVLLSDEEWGLKAIASIRNLYPKSLLLHFVGRQQQQQKQQQLQQQQLESERQERRHRQEEERPHDGQADVALIEWRDANNNVYLK